MIEVIIETVLATLALVSISYLVYNVYSLKKANRELANIALMESLQKNAATSKLEETLLLINNTNVEDKDGFIKFLSESREAAFEYIENVQLSIQSYLAAVERGDPEEILSARLELSTHLPSTPESERNG